MNTDQAFALLTRHARGTLSKTDREFLAEELAIVMLRRMLRESPQAVAELPPLPARPPAAPADSGSITLVYERELR